MILKQQFKTLGGAQRHAAIKTARSTWYTYFVMPRELEGVYRVGRTRKLKTDKRMGDEA